MKPAIVSQRQPTAVAPVAAIVPATDDLAAFWVPRINLRLAKSIEAIIGTGMELLAAKTKVKHGQWEKLFEPGQLCVNLRTAQKLMAIAGNGALSKTTNYSLLPSTIDSLDHLAGVDPLRLQLAIDKGRVLPTMTIQETRVVASELKPRKVTPSPSPKRNDERKPPITVSQPAPNAAAIIDVSAVPLDSLDLDQLLSCLDQVQAAVMQFLADNPHHREAVLRKVFALWGVVRYPPKQVPPTNSPILRPTK